MKIVINIEKKHLYFLLIFLSVIGIGIVIATGYNGEQSHATLFTNTIKSRDSGLITINDNMLINPQTRGGDSLSLQPNAGPLNLNGNLLVGVNWPGSLPAGGLLYKNTVPCDLTMPTNAITLVGSCSGNSGSCGGTYGFNGQSCRIYNNNPHICELVRCSYNAATMVCDSGNINGISCSNFNENDCNAIWGGCSWIPADPIRYNAPLGRLVYPG